MACIWVLDGSVLDAIKGGSTETADLLLQRLKTDTVYISGQGFSELVELGGAVQIREGNRLLLQEAAMPLAGTRTPRVGCCWTCT